MTRKRQLSEEEIESIIRESRKEAKAAKVRMEAADAANDLANYRRNEIIYRMEIATISDMMQKLHPHVPPSWYNEYGEQIRPDTVLPMMRSKSPRDDDFNQESE